MKLSFKILSLPIIVSLFLMGLCGFVLMSLSQINDNVKTVTRTLAPQAKQSTLILQNILERNNLVQAYLRTNDNANIESFTALQAENASMIDELGSYAESKGQEEYLQSIVANDAIYSRTFLNDVVENNLAAMNVANSMLEKNGPSIVNSLIDIIETATATENQAVAAAASDALRAFQSARIFIGQFILNNNPTHASRVEMEFMATDNALFDLETLVRNPRHVEFTRVARVDFDSFMLDFQTVLAAIESRNKATNGPLISASKDIVDTALELQDFIWSELDSSGQVVEDTINTTSKAVEITTVIALILGLIPALLVTRSIKLAIQKTVDMAQSIARGELDQEVKKYSKDETGQLLSSLDTMVSKLTEVVGRIQTAAGTVKTGASDISAGNKHLSERTMQQAENLNGTAITMVQMATAVKHNAENAVRASGLAQDAREKAQKSSEVAGDAVTAMSEINESSQKISQIIGVIDEIAFQTNLLALNAAVEAARAGESGRGFAVVASEVRGLAGRSATAANEIKSLIVDSTRKVEDGTALVNLSRDSLGDIVREVKEVSDVVNEIALANQEQSSGIDQLNQAIESMEKLTQQNTTLVSGAATASELLGSQADELNELTSFFKSKM